MARHAIVVVCDALHLGCVGCYGSDWVETPAIDRLADDGFLFDQCYPETPTSGGWWRTGLSGTWRVVAEPAETPLLNVLATAGVNVGVLWPNGQAAPPVRCDWRIAVSADSSPPAQFAAAGEWLRNRRGRSSLAWLQLDLASGGWPTPAEFTEQYAAPPAPNLRPGSATDVEHPAAGDPAVARSSYAARVACFDAAFGMFLDGLHDAGLYDDTLLVLTADQGYALGEHGVIGLQRPWLHEERAHVPLVVRFAGSARAARSGALIQSADLFGTLAELFGIELRESSVPLQNWARGGSATARRYVCSGLADTEYAIGTRRWRLILPVRTEPGAPPRRRMLFAKPDDRWEVDDLVAAQPVIADQLELQLRRHLDAVYRGTPELLLPLSEDV